jgi:hypothetical protein
MKLIQTMILAVAAMGALLRREIAAANTYDAAVETHANSVTRTNDAAIDTRHLLWKKGAADGTVAICTHADPPLGTIDNIETDTGARQTVLLLGKGPTKKMIAAEEIVAGEAVYTADDGKIQDQPTGDTVWMVGTSLTAGGANAVIEVNCCVPVRMVFA